MIFLRTRRLCMALILIAFFVPMLAYERMPASVPMHWDMSGQADRWMSKAWGAFVMPTVTALVFALLRLLPRISPRGFRIERFTSAYEIILLSTVAFLAFTSTLVTLAQLGIPVPMDRAVRSGAGMLFVILGNLMGKLRRNFFIGIRTPWTLASEEVWLRTHRLGGKLFVLAGFVVFVTALVATHGTAILLVAVSLAALVPSAYSFWLYRRLAPEKQ
jgi:uncharacterized membrane protein